MAQQIDSGQAIKHDLFFLKDSQEDVYMSIFVHSNRVYVIPMLLLFSACEDMTDPGGQGTVTSLPFAIHEFHLNQSDEASYIADLGVLSAKVAPPHGLVWDAVEVAEGVYDWRPFDEAYASVDGIELSVMISAENRFDSSEMGYFPNDIERYLDFLRSAAERYDGDGIEDAPASPVISVWQIGNEVDGFFWNDTPENYALLLKLSAQAIKEVFPGAKVAIAGTATPWGYYDFYRPVLAEIAAIADDSNDRYFDIFDFHWSGQFPGDNDYHTINYGNQAFAMRMLINDIQNDLASYGYQGVTLQIGEMSDYSDTPSGYSTHTEIYHAGQVIKRNIYAIASGVERIFWNQIVEQHSYGGNENGYFDHVGLINNPLNDGIADKKLAYFSYKKMVEMLNGSDWSRVEVIQESDGLYLYRFSKPSSAVWVAWNDNGFDIEMTLTGLDRDQMRITDAVPMYERGSYVTDYTNAFSSNTVVVNDGAVTITLGDKPVFIE